MIRNLPRIFFIVFLFTASFSLKAQTRVTITDFSVSTKEHRVTIDWKTEGSTAANYFAIQKSSDGINYKTMALVLGPDPKKGCDCYGGFDNKNTTKDSYYRLVHIDSNGNEQVTEAKHLARP